MSGASAVTVIVSSIAPTSSVEVERHELLRGDADAVALEGLVAGERRADAVGRGRERRKVVLAGGIGHRFAGDGRRLVDHRDRDAGNHAVGSR